MVYLDSNAVIYSVEKVAPYWPLLESVWAASAARNARLVVSELLVLEVLVGPLQAGDTELVALFDTLFQSDELSLVPIALSILRRAAQLRALHRIKAADAIHAATALEARCSHFITNDRDFRHVSGLNVVLMDEVVAAET